MIGFSRPGRARNQQRSAISRSFKKFLFRNGLLTADALRDYLKKQEVVFKRRMARWASRENRHATYFAAGLNGTRAVTRRLRQIAAGQLTVSNGLV